jgi:hypothetical protein
MPAELPFRHGSVVFVAGWRDFDATRIWDVFGVLYPGPGHVQDVARSWALEPMGGGRLLVHRQAEVGLTITSPPAPAGSRGCAA